MKKERASTHPWSAGVESCPLEKLSVEKQKKKEIDIKSNYQHRESADHGSFQFMEQIDRK